MDKTFITDYKIIDYVWWAAIKGRQVVEESARKGGWVRRLMVRIR